jgi:hypothetical protein
MMQLSVVIPVFNAERYLRRCLDSVLAQTLHDIEIICINDGSTDGSAAILAEYAAKDSRVRVLCQPENAGQGAARNRGLEVANGEYVYFMDADDELAFADVLGRLVGEAARESLDACFFDAETRVDDGLEAQQPLAVNAEGYIRRKDYSKSRTGRELFFLMLKNREYSASPCLVLLRREFLEKNCVRFPAERVFYEDNIFMTRVMLSAERASHRPWRLYLRRVHAGSAVTSLPTMRHVRGYLACYCDACELLSRGGWDKRTRAALRDRRAVYKLHVRRLAEANPELVFKAKGEMSEAEYASLREVLVYPFCEKVVNAFRCLRDRGLFFTVKRILCGRQDT